MKKIITLALSLLTAGALFGGEWKDISIGDLKKAISEKKVVVIDVNGTESYKAGHIPGAIDFESSVDKLASILPADKNALVVAYCGGPACNAYQEGAKKAEALGYKNILHLTAGISGWKTAGEALEK